MKFNLGGQAGSLQSYSSIRRPPFSPAYRLISHLERNRSGGKISEHFASRPHHRPASPPLPPPASAPLSLAFDKAADPWNCTDCKLQAIFAGRNVTTFRLEIARYPDKLSVTELSQSPWSPLALPLEVSHWRPISRRFRSGDGGWVSWNLPLGILQCG